MDSWHTTHLCLPPPSSRYPACEAHTPSCGTAAGVNEGDLVPNEKGEVMGPQMTSFLTAIGTANPGFIEGFPLFPLNARAACSNRTRNTIACYSRRPSLAATT